MYFSLLILFLYLLIVAGFIIGWEKLPAEEPAPETDSRLLVALIVPFRNEAAQLPRLLSSVAGQSYRHFELILINDHSTDDFLPAIEAFREKIPALQTVQAIGFGKKNALAEGIAQARADFIVCTDADCELPQDYLKSIVQYQAKENVDLLLCPVRIADGANLFERLQALEFASLMASGAGAAALGAPVLCNGANIAFTASTWHENMENLNTQELSGDDMFLLMSVKKRGGKIRFLKSRAATTTTLPCRTVSAFFEQRKRWTSKAKAYTDRQVLFVGLTVLLLCTAMIVCCFAGFYNRSYLYSALLLFILKTTADSLLLVRCASFFSLQKTLFLIPLLALIYPFYVVVSAAGGLFGSFRWK